MSEKHSLRVELSDNLRVGQLSRRVSVFVFRAVRELLFNSSKHAGTDEARVHVERETGRIRVAVADEGVGFDSAALDEYCIASGGLGLWSLRERVEALGGKLEVESQPGRGTRITIILPLDDGRDSRPTPVPRALVDMTDVSPTLDTRSPIRIIVADDHRLMREGLVTLLDEEPDLEVVGEAGDGKKAVELVRLLCPDVVVMDVSMPIVDGVEATKQLHEDLPNVQIVGLSMYKEAEITRKMIDAGAAVHLSKGGRSDALLAAIRAAHSRR
jgi:CheY-like chemotaxis protein/anti-sigma regulatory factor (Ser/Thr protein kinase)